MWEIFVYASNKENGKAERWQKLWTRKGQWGNKWLLGGDFNDVRRPQEKQGGRTRFEASCKGFKDFVERMDMEEVEHKGGNGPGLITGQMRVI